MSRPRTFALYFGNRGFFPERLVAEARRQMQAAVEQAGCRAIMEGATLHFVPGLDARRHEHDRRRHALFQRLYPATRELLAELREPAGA